MKNTRIERKPGTDSLFGSMQSVSVPAFRGVEILLVKFAGYRVSNDGGSSNPPIEGFDANSCIPTIANATRAQVTWQGGKDLSALAGMPVQFRFHVKNARLYSFWVSNDTNGASNGYVAAGGPGLSRDIDTSTPSIQ